MADEQYYQANNKCDKTNKLTNKTQQQQQQNPEETKKETNKKLPPICISVAVVPSSPRAMRLVDS